MPYETIAYAVSDSILTVTLHRPDKLNAFNTTMMQELLDAFDRADNDDDVRAIIVTGSGRAFCAGADLTKGAAAFDYLERPDKAALGSPVRPDGSVDYAHEAVRDNGGRVTLRMFRCLKPIIGAVNGPAVGIGATLLLPMDVRIASEDARFAFPFSRRGLVQESCASWFLPRIVGIATALDWCISGRMFFAAEAERRGLVQAVRPAAELLPAARAIASEMVANSAPVSVALIRQLLWNGLTMNDPEDAHRLESRAIYARGQSLDLREGVAAFLEKRAPDFHQRVTADMPDFYPWRQEKPYG